MVGVGTGEADKKLGQKHTRLKGPGQARAPPAEQPTLIMLANAAFASRSTEKLPWTCRMASNSTR